jgi:hypothetical protein
VTNEGEPLDPKMVDHGNHVVSVLLNGVIGSSTILVRETAATTINQNTGESDLYQRTSKSGFVFLRNELGSDLSRKYGKRSGQAI